MLARILPDSRPHVSQLADRYETAARRSMVVEVQISHLFVSFQAPVSSLYDPNKRYQIDKLQGKSKKIKYV